MNKQLAGQQYSRINTQTGVVDADPHRLIQMLFSGALEQVSVARGCIQRDDVEGKGVAISKAIGIVGGLRDSLNHEASQGTLSTDLAALYEFVTTRLSDANIQGDVTALDEAAKVLRELAEGWNAIRGEAMEQLDRGNLAPA